MSTAILNTTTLNDLAERINREHRECTAAVNAGLQHALEAGRLLLEAKGLCRHGTWGEWLADNFQGSERTAQVYIRVAKRWPELEAKAQTSADLSLDGALKLLAAPRAAEGSFALKGIEPETVLREVQELGEELYQVATHPMTLEKWKRAAEIRDRMADLVNDARIWELNLIRAAGDYLNLVEEKLGKEEVRECCKAAGIKGKERWRWQAAAKVPAEAYVDWAVGLRERRGEITLGGLVRLAMSGALAG